MARSSATSSSGKAPNGDRLAAGFDDRRRDDRAVAVVDARAGRARRPAAPARRRSRAPRRAGLRTTSTSAMPQAASMPISRDEMRRPAPQHHLAARDVGAGIGDELSGRDRAAHVDRRRAALVDRARCARSSSRRRRRAAPRRRWRSWWRCPGATSSAGGCPQTITSPLRRRRRGAVSLAPAVSAERSAKPSTLARSNGGTSIGAVTSCASTRPSAVGERDGLGRRAARDRHGAQTAHAPRRPTPLRGTAPAARRDGSRRSSSCSADFGSTRAVMARVLS